jgi:hypothetical protein
MAGFRTVTSRTLGIYARYRPVEWFFISGGAGWTHIAADSLYLAGTKNTVGGFTDNLPTVSAGAGVSWYMFFMEYRWIYGTRRANMAPESTAAIAWRNLRFGLMHTF